MKTINLITAKKHFSAIIEKVEQGAQFIITKYGKPVAMLVAISENKNHKGAKKAIARIEELSKHLTLGNINLKTLRDKGRK